MACRAAIIRCIGQALAQSLDLPSGARRGPRLLRDSPPPPSGVSIPAPHSIERRGSAVSGAAAVRPGEGVPPSFPIIGKKEAAS